MDVLVGLIGATVIIGGIGVLLYYYARFLANMDNKKREKTTFFRNFTRKGYFKIL